MKRSHHLMNTNLIGTSVNAIRSELGDATASNSTTATMGVGDQFTGALQSLGDVDWVKIDLVAGKTYRITLDGSGQNGVVDTVLTLYGPGATNSTASKSKIVAQNDDSADGPIGSGSLITYTATTSGSYYIAAAAWNNRAMGGYIVETQDISGPLPNTVWTTAQIARQLTDGYWDKLGNTTRAFDLSANREITVNLDQLVGNQTYIAYAQRALQLWSDVTGITFTATSDSNAGIYFTDNAGGAWSDSDIVRTGQTSKITQSQVNVEPNWSGADYTLQTFVHEIGHALGLGHAGNYNGSAGFGTDNLYLNDSWQASVMSYFSQSENTYLSQNVSFAYLLTPMLADIVAMRVLYGSSYTTRTGNDVYGFNATAGFDAAALNGQGSQSAYALTIIDDGGVDTIDLSGSNFSNLVNLNQLAASNTGGLKGNLFIAPDTIIENAIGGAGNDTLVGNTAYNALTAGLGNDSLSGGAGNDSLLGGDGADTLDGGGEDDVLNGGGAGDTATYRDTTSGVTVILDQSAQDTGGAGRDTLIDIENIIGSGFGDSLTGNGGVNLLDGGDGNDTLAGGAGDDSLIGGAGIDYAFYDVLLENISVTYNRNSDSFTVTSANSGTDLLSFVEYLRLNDVQDYSLASYRIQSLTLVNDIWIGTAINDEVRGLAGADSLNGGAGDDTIDGGADNDTLDGGADVDTASYATATSAVTVNLSTGQATGGAGNDSLIGIENVIGSDFADTLIGNSAANEIRGGIGKDTITGGGGNDMLSGGADDDLFLLSRVGDLGATAQILGGDGNDTLRLTTTAASTLTLTTGISVERVEIGTGLATTAISVNASKLQTGITIVGNAGINTLTGGAEADSLDGGAGDDVLIGGVGNDTLNGSLGMDTANYATATERLTLSLAVTMGQTVGSFGTDTFISIENLIAGSGSDFLTGNDLANVLTGGTGNDTLIGGLGNDGLAGGGGTDTASYVGTFAVNANLTRGTATGVGTDTLTAIENLIGSSRNDTLTGSAALNEIDGGAGNDLIEGGAGADILTGGDGLDLFIVSFAADMVADEQIFGAGDELRFVTTTASTLTLASRVDVAHVVIGTGTAAVALTTATTAINVDGAKVIGNQWITGNAGANKMTGGIGADLLEGGRGVDTLIGGGGADTLNGGVGLDMLTGGAGADVFVFNTALTTSNKDTITDFNGTDDTIHLAKSVMSTLVTGQLAENAFWASTLGISHIGTDRILYNQNTGVLSYDADGTGSTAAVQIAQLSAGLTLTYQDFWVTLA